MPHEKFKLADSKIFKPMSHKVCKIIFWLSEMAVKRCSSSLSRALLFFAAFMLSALPVAAGVSIQTDKGVYNFGDSIVASYSFSRDQDFSGLVKLSLFCTSFDLEFYTLPTNIYAGESQDATVPPLTISPGMLGRCYVAANATSYDKSANESGTSNFFNVTNQFSVSVALDHESYLPRAAVDVSGKVGKSHSLPAGVVMAFLGANYASTVAEDSFSYSIKLPKNIKAGQHALDFIVNDSYGNSGSASAAFKVDAVPTRIVNSLGKQSLKPLEPFGLSVNVYDQADDRLSGEVSVSIADSSGAIVLSSRNGTGSNMSLSFPAQQKQGNYVLTSFAFGLSASSPLVVEEVEEASVMFDNRTVVLKNTGNVGYSRKFNISLSGTRKNYVLVHDVNLAPGQSLSVDLTEAVSEDSYAVAFPTVSSAAPVENVFLEDNRNFLKRASDAFGISRTGRAVSNSGSGSSDAFARLAPLLLVAVVGMISFYFIRGRRRSGSGMADAGFSTGPASPYDSSAPIAGPAAVAVSKPSIPEEDRVRQIIEEKRRQLMERQQQQPKSLRDDPAAQKFVRDIMKEKKFR